MDKIGYFKGKPISEMTREELLHFAQWAGNKIAELQSIADKHMELDLHKEIFTKEK